ncbi:MAG: hypothetical protein IJJ80_04120 [Clostridia bacterium]|nr:hypothetical protein [Clostridia bacterium]
MENKKRTLGFTIGFISAVIALVTGIVLWIYGAAVGDHYAVVPIILILGACIALVGLVMKLPFLSILPGAAYMTAMGLYITSQMGNISGRLSDTGFGATGTELGMLIAFCVLMLVATILALVTSFMKQSKETA